MKNKYLVIGGNGFIGRNLCEQLKDLGKQVTSFDLEYPNDRISSITYKCGNFFDDSIIENLVKNQDVIYHCISTINPSNSVFEYMRGYEKDFIQTIKLFDLIKGQNTKVIFLSSGGTVYGDVKKMPIKETNPCNPKNHYGNLKLCIENFIRTYNRINHSHHVIARISNPYGPGQDSNKGVGFIDAVIRRGLSHEKVEVWGDGNIIRDYIYIKDVCKMLYLLSEYRGNEEVFNVSSNCGETQNQIIDYVKQYIADLEVVYKESRAIDAKKIVLCNDRMKTVMKEKLTSISEGIKLYIQYLEGEKYEN